MKLKTKPTTILLLLLFLFLSACQSSKETDSNSNSSLGDWPSYDFKELVSVSDLIVYGEITKTENKKTTPRSQESNLHVIKVIKGNESNNSITLNLSDSNYYVKSGSKYIIFLDNTGAYYTQKSADSILEEINGTFSSSIQGLKGDYSLEEIQLEISKIPSEK